MAVQRTIIVVGFRIVDVDRRIIPHNVVVIVEATTGQDVFQIAKRQLLTVVVAAVVNKPEYQFSMLAIHIPMFWLNPVTTIHVLESNCKPIILARQFLQPCEKFACRLKKLRLFRLRSCDSFNGLINWLVGSVVLPVCIFDLATFVIRIGFVFIDTIVLFIRILVVLIITILVLLGIPVIVRRDFVPTSTKVLPPRIDCFVDDDAFWFLFMKQTVLQEVSQRLFSPLQGTQNAGNISTDRFRISLCSC